jgi:hypothetical protein
MQARRDMLRFSFNPRELRLAFVAAATLAGGCNAVFGIHDGTPPPPCYDPTGWLIDDMEDGTSDICNLDGRHGYWFTVGDGTSTMLDPAQGTPFTPAMIPGGRGKSHYAARFTGSGFTDFGAFMGFDFDAQGTATKTYDASSTGGITFWMKSNVSVSIEFLIPETVLLKNGGSCVASATNPNCNSHFSFEITAPSPDWTQYYVPFAALAQINGGTATWNPQQLLGVEFFVGPGAAFDVWVDDVSFYLCTTGGCKPTCTDPAFTLSCPAGANYPAACRTTVTNCAAAANWCSDPQMIDDMEDGNGTICNSGGRSGTWFTVADGTEGTLSPVHGASFVMTPIPGGRDDSQIAAHMTASGFTSWAQLGLFLNEGTAGIGGPYDESASGGITFWMKTDAPDVVVALPISETTPVSRGGTCLDGATTANCDNDFEFYITSPSNDWVQYHVPHSALSQLNGKSDANGNLIAGSAPWDPTHLTGIKFNVYQPFPSFDLWVDDLSFYDCAGETCLPTCGDPAAVACPALGAVSANCWPAGTDCSNLSSLLGTNAILTQVWGNDPDDVWSVGTVIQGSPAAASPTMLHWDGSVWSSAESGTAHPLWGVWGSSSDDIWAVGDFGTIVHWDGTGWSSAMSVATQSSLSAVWGSAANDIWAVGAKGTIVHGDGSAWSVTTSVSSGALYRLWGSGPSDVWAVGDAGTILYYDGSVWSPSASGTESALWGVWGSSSSDVYAVGNTTTGEATILHWNGAVWSTVSTPADGYPNSVWGSGPDDVWVVGDSILHFDGATWSTVPNPASYYLAGVWGSGPSDAWIVGSTGTLLHWDGTAWSAVPTAGIQ